MGKKLRKYQLPTGYRLHVQRLSVLSSGEPIRTFKYELDLRDQRERERIVQRIFSEYQSLEGIRTLDQWFSQSEGYSVIDFWFDSLCIGGLFQPKESALRDLGQSLVSADSAEGRFFESMPDNIKEKFDKNRWIRQFTKELRSNGKNRELRFIETLKCEKDREHPKVLNLLARWIAVVPEGVGIGRGDHLKLVAEIFNADVAVFENQPEHTIDLTYLIEPRLLWHKWKPGDDRSVLIGQLIQERISLFRDIGLPERKFDEIAGLSDNGNALSNYLNVVLSALREGNIKSVVKEMAVRRPYSMKELEVVHERLAYLVERAKSLPLPYLATGWHEYRSTVVGRLTSYLTNMARLNEQRQNRPKEIREDIEQAIRQGLIPEERLESASKVMGLLQLPGLVGNPVESALAESELAEVRSHLNSSLQKSGSEVSLPKKFPALAKGLPRPVHFPGDERIALFQAYSQGPENIGYLLKSIVPLLEVGHGDDRTFSDPEMERLRKTLNTLRSVQMDKHVRQHLPQMHKHIADMLPNQVYWRDPRSRVRKTVIAPVHYPTLAEVTRLCTSVISQFQTLTSVQQPLFVVDILELFRVVGAIVLRNFDDTTLSQVQRNIQECVRYSPVAEAWDAVCASSATQTRLVLERWTQRYVAAQCRGLLVQVSRRRFISRGVVQTINGPSTLAYQLRGSNRRYAVRLQLKNLDKEEGESSAWHILDKEGKGSVSRGGCLVELCVGKYQRQFLDEALTPSRLLATSVNGAALIAERELEPQWDSRGHLSGLRVVSERVFHAQPFTFKSRARRPAFRPDRYLGLDVGEYGIAWCVIECASQGVQIIAAGTIQDPQYRKLQREVDKLRKEDQPRGTLTVSSTKIARLRESLVGSLRNRIHALTLKYAAKPVYEMEIDAFETGGNRIKKVYASVKKADVAMDEAGTALRASLWGTKRRVGNTVAAGGTSQLCSACKRWYRDYLGKEVWEEGKLYEAQQVSGYPNVYQVSIKGHELFLYWEDPARNPVLTLNGKSLAQAIKQYLRPPMKEGVVSAAVFHAGVENNVRENRGSSHQFICPFSDCTHHADADMQAAYNIAVKSWLKDSNRGIKRSPAGQVREASDDIITYTQAQWQSDLLEKKHLIPAFTISSSEVISPHVIGEFKKTEKIA
jgi:hypothetical protein